MKTLILLAALAAPLLAAANTNLLVNGSFESTSAAPGATVGFAGWTPVPGSAVTPPGTVTYGTPGAFFGATIPVNNTASASPDAVGLRAFYLADDASPEALSSGVLLGPGVYSAGFDYYVPRPVTPTWADATLWVNAGTTNLWNPNLSSLQFDTWQNFASTFTVSAPTMVIFVFDKTPYGSASLPALDVLFDRAYVMAVPELSAGSSMLCGLAVLGLLLAKRHRAGST